MKNNTKTIKISKKSYNTMRKGGNNYKIKISSIVYDEDIDILEVYINQKTDYCENLDDFTIIHFNKNKKIVGLEFLDISKTLGIPKKVLNNLKTVEILININPEERKMALKTKMISIISEKQTNINFISTPLPMESNQLIA